MPTSFSSPPTYLGLTGGAYIYRIELGAFGFSSIRSIILDDDGISGASGGRFSGIDLDFVSVSSTLTNSASTARGLVSQGVFNFSTGASVQHGYIRPATSGESGPWSTLGLFGSPDRNQLNNSVATLGVADASTSPNNQGFVSLGEGGRISLTLNSNLTAAGNYLYFGMVNQEGATISVTDFVGPPVVAGFNLSGRDIIGLGGADYIGMQLGMNASIGAGSDTINGQGGNDTIYGGQGDDVLFGGDEADQLFGGEGADQVNGGTGNDYMTGELGNDTLLGDAGNDALVGGIGNDSLAGGTGNDVMLADGGNDTLLGDENNDLLWGYGGNDSLAGGDGNDALVGSDFLVSGLAEFNTLLGGAGNDSLFAGVDGTAIMKGESGNDVFFGGNGADFLYGGTGNDTLYGAGGADSFFFETADIVTGQSDQILYFDSLDVIYLPAIYNGAVTFQDVPGGVYMQINFGAPGVWNNTVLTGFSASYLQSKYFFFL